MSWFVLSCSIKNAPSSPGLFYRSFFELVKRNPKPTPTASNRMNHERIKSIHANQRHPAAWEQYHTFERIPGPGAGRGSDERQARLFDLL
jgi:hypothetical protein